MTLELQQRDACKTIAQFACMNFQINHALNPLGTGIGNLTCCVFCLETICGGPRTQALAKVLESIVDLSLSQPRLGVHYTPQAGVTS